MDSVHSGLELCALCGKKLISGKREGIPEFGMILDTPGSLSKTASGYGTEIRGAVREAE